MGILAQESESDEQLFDHMKKFYEGLSPPKGTPDTFADCRDYCQ
jgi:hypothetical protein